MSKIIILVKNYNLSPLFWNLSNNWFLSPNINRLKSRNTGKISERNHLNKLKSIYTKNFLTELPITKESFCREVKKDKEREK